MSLNGYLESLAAEAIVRDEEKDKIKKSIASLKLRLDESLGEHLNDQFIFGSYSRGTILPRHMNPNSDVDYLIVFKDASLSPRTYLDWLRKFSKEKYSTSEVFQSHPTIVLSLNHIHIELVPAVSEPFALQYKIPGKSSNYSKWIYTNPKEFNVELTNENAKNKNNIKKLIRVMKYWNIINGRPFESYELEQNICRQNYGITALFQGNLKDYFFEFVKKYNICSVETKKQYTAIASIQKSIEKVRSLEAEETQKKSILDSLLISSDMDATYKGSITLLKKILPPPD